MNADWVESDRGTILCDGIEYFPASLLSKILNMSRAGIYKLAEREGWPLIKVPGRGAKDGVQHFCVSERILAEINLILDGGKQAITSRTYPISDKATALKLKSPENVFNPSDFDPLLMHHVIVAVEKMLKKHGKTIDPEKKADLFFLIHDCCKAAGGMDDSIVERFVSVAG